MRRNGNRDMWGNSTSLDYLILRKPCPAFLLHYPFLWFCTVFSYWRSCFPEEGGSITTQICHGSLGCSLASLKTAFNPIGMVFNQLCDICSKIQKDNCDFHSHQWMVKRMFPHIPYLLTSKLSHPNISHGISSLRADSIQHAWEFSHPALCVSQSQLCTIYLFRDDCSEQKQTGTANFV